MIWQLCVCLSHSLPTLSSHHSSPFPPSLHTLLELHFLPLAAKPQPQGRHLPSKIGMLCQYRRQTEGDCQTLGEEMWAAWPEGDLCSASTVHSVLSCSATSLHIARRVACGHVIFCNFRHFAGCRYVLAKREGKGEGRGRRGVADLCVCVCWPHTFTAFE